jgi:hypothetical protein
LNIAGNVLSGEIHKTKNKSFKLFDLHLSYWQDLFMKSTLDSVFKVILGVELDTMCGTYREGTQFSIAFDEASAAIMFRYVNFLWKVQQFLNIGSEAVLEKSLMIDDYVYKVITSKIEQSQKPQNNSWIERRHFVKVSRIE